MIDLLDRPTHISHAGASQPSVSPPSADVPQAASYVCRVSLEVERFGNSTTNSIWYPPGGFMDWHTNSNNPGKRLYVAWSETGESGMKWFRDGAVVDDPDQPGWNVRVFDTPQWHMVYANCWRYSIGWKV
jgi:hypothetical protein